MKKTVILSVLVLATMNIMAQNSSTIRQNLQNKVHNVYVGNNFNAFITFDNNSYVEFQSLTQNDVKKIKDNNMITIKNDTLFLGYDSCKTCSGTVYIHLDSTNRNTNIFLSNNAQGYFNNLCNSNIRIEAKDYSQVAMSKLLGDTLWCKRLYVHTSDHAYTIFQTPLVGDSIELIANDNSRISASTIDCNYLYYYEIYRDKNIAINSNKKIKHKKHVCKDKDSWYDEDSRYDEYDDDEDFLEHHINFDFAWGFHNWTNNPFNGLYSLDDAYELRTTPSSFQLALSYRCPIVRKRLHFQAGLGYESDVYKFRNQYITITDNTPKHLDMNGTQPIAGQCATKLVTRYVTFPIGLFFSKNKLRASITMIPGISYTNSHTGLKYNIKNNDDKHYMKENPKNFINPYKLDLRFAVGYKLFKFFIQPSLLPVFINTDQKVYPIKIGIII
ncbi:MAG: hypothetical protein J5605_02130 [Bacteroidales bacterium]|nr:hypothetical protein [Bacteroidales bacterium]